MTRARSTSAELTCRLGKRSVDLDHLFVGPEARLFGVLGVAPQFTQFGRQLAEQRNPWR